MIWSVMRKHRFHVMFAAFWEGALREGAALRDCDKGLLLARLRRPPPGSSVKSIQQTAVAILWRY